MTPIDPKRLDGAIDDVILMMKQHFHEDVDADEVHAQFAMLCTVDPKTGESFPTGPDKAGFGVVIIIPSSMADDDAKDQMAMTLRMIAVAGAAAASVWCFDTWMAVGKGADEAMKQGLRPSEYSGRIEAMCCAVERRGRPALLEYHSYKRLDDGVAFGDSERAEGAKMSGRFAGLIPQHDPPPDVVKTIRAVLNMSIGSKLDWIPL